MLLQRFLLSFLSKVAPRVLILLIPFCLILSGCASSNVSRYAATNVDLGVQNAKNLVVAGAEGSIVDTYQNLGQSVKGALIGGAAGAIVGSVSSGGIGTLAGAGAGVIFGASYGAYINSNINLEDDLRNRGVNLVELGDQLMIVIPSARLFSPMASQIRPEAFTTLYLVTKYINRFNKILVKIAAYTNDTGSPRVDISLSNEQAQSIAKFFLADGIDARLLYAVGYGGTHLVSRNALTWGASDNYRIEITLEKMYA